MVSLSFFSPRRPPSKQRTSNVEYVPNDPCPRLDFWISGSRDDLVERILPYLTRSYREEQYITTIIEQNPWMAELVHSESENEKEQQDEDVEPDPKDFAKCKSNFEKFPQPMVDSLVSISRSWFRILFRYTFRARYANDTDHESTHLDIEDLYGKEFNGRIDEKSLLRRSTLYKEYKDIYKETKNRPAWIDFCARIKSFCRIIKLETSSTKLEGIYEDLQRNLPQILLGRMEEMKRMATSLQDELEIHRLDESLKACRELMEKLLPDDGKGKGAYRPRGQEYGRRWREFFAKEWQRCKKERPKDHPLLDLVDQDECFQVGQNLYGTLSERIHNHQEYRNQELGEVLLKMIFSILPQDWEEVRRWDLPTEKKRWGVA
ncbi:hypothetical protein DM02DRAFT_623852 [Periconia macrospinosa]|uniref:Uncharacterized protein n=1 Tax=Periconia macrospinosa TaxID=97972 RepID=A0A2V1E6S3_9PLEO|nr:hypothetical protein DM02DRAFT_623852 [Periconia macrospinosa]